MRPITGYQEYSPSAEYLHLLSAPMWSRLAGRLAAVLSGVDPGSGTVVEFGAGTGLGTDVLLDTLHPAPVLVAEPSAHLRAVLPSPGSALAAMPTVSLCSPAGSPNCRCPNGSRRPSACT